MGIYIYKCIYTWGSCVPCFDEKDVFWDGCMCQYQNTPLCVKYAPFNFGICVVFIEFTYWITETT